jgi:hypothetical protein
MAFEGRKKYRVGVLIFRFSGVFLDALVKNAIKLTEENRKTGTSIRHLVLSRVSCEAFLTCAFGLDMLYGVFVLRLP